jgi:hypothetical protein
VIAEVLGSAQRKLANKLIGTFAPMHISPPSSKRYVLARVVRSMDFAPSRSSGESSFVEECVLRSRQERKMRRGRSRASGGKGTLSDF